MASNRTVQRLLETFQQEKAFTASPPDLHDMFKESRYALTFRNSLDDTATWSLVQQHFYLALMTGHDVDAELALGELTQRFGADAERVVLCKSQYLEVTKGISEAEAFLKKREEKEIISMKRRIALDKFSNDYKSYISNLLNLLSFIPTDAETWAELGEAYSTIQEYRKAIHAFQEVLLFVPNAYNIFSRLGELYHAAALQDAGASGSTEVDFTTLSNSAKENVLEALKQALKNYLRSVELCPVYVRGWSGVQVVSSEALKVIEGKNASKKAAKPAGKSVQVTSPSSLLSDKEYKYFKQFAEISERNLLYATSEKEGNQSKPDIEAAKAILRDY